MDKIKRAIVVLIIISCAIMLMSRYCSKNTGYYLDSIDLSNSTCSIIKDDRIDSLENDLSGLEIRTVEKQEINDDYTNYVITTNPDVRRDRGYYRVNINIPCFTNEKSLTNNHMIEIMFSALYELFDQSKVADAIISIDNYNRQCIQEGNRYELLIDYDVIYYTKDCISLIIYLFSYRGEAHPLQDAYFATYDIGRGTIMLFEDYYSKDDIYDLFDEKKCELIDAETGEVLPQTQESIILHYEYVESLKQYENQENENDLFCRNSWSNIGVDENYIYLKTYPMPYEFEYERLLLRIRKEER